MKPAILIVDDSDLDRQAIGILLKNETDYEISFAWDGCDALNYISHSPVDLVVTDLLMPEMDGLELVRAMRGSYADVPVVLVTGYGSEDIAAEALAEGASSYVLKSQIGKTLVTTIRRLIARRMAERHREIPPSCVSEGYFSFDLDNDPSMIEPLLDVLQQMMARFGVGDAADRIRAATAVEEALLNAIYHGNLEIGAEELESLRKELGGERLERLVVERRLRKEFQQRKVKLDVYVTRGTAKFKIRDQGRGFDFRKTIGERMEDHFERDGGRGLVLMQSLVDEVEFSELANEVTLLKRSRAPEDPLHRSA